MRKFIADRRGVFAIEVAILMPFLVLFCAGFVWLQQYQQQNFQAQWLSIVGAQKYATLLAATPDRSVVEPQVTALLQTNETMMLGSGTLMGITYTPIDATTTTVTITLISGAYFSVFADTIMSTQNATQ